MQEPSAPTPHGLTEGSDNLAVAAVVEDPARRDHLRRFQGVGFRGLGVSEFRVWGSGATGLGAEIITSILLGSRRGTLYYIIT